MNAEKANIQNSMDAAEIPEYVFESLARSLLPVIQKYYESEGGKKAFAEWKAKKEISDSASTWDGKYIIKQAKHTIGGNGYRS